MGSGLGFEWVSAGVGVWLGLPDACVMPSVVHSALELTLVLMTE